MILQVDPGGLGPCSVRLTALVLGGSWDLVSMVPLRVLQGSIIGFLQGIYKNPVAGIMGLSKYGYKYFNWGNT